MLIMSWILTACKEFKLGAYLSDISGAFDRVFKPCILGKLNAAGIGDKYLNFFSSYLETRRARVAVGGAPSDPFEILDMIFQGTVLGPPLWNAFFADVALAASATGGNEAMFADDLNVFRKFHFLEDHALIREKM